jgi:hypothetical protein
MSPAPAPPPRAAPCSSSHSTTSACPCAAASMSGVQRLKLNMLTSRLIASRGVAPTLSSTGSCACAVLTTVPLGPSYAAATIAAIDLSTPRRPALAALCHIVLPPEKLLQ